MNLRSIWFSIFISLPASEIAFPAAPKQEPEESLKLGCVYVSSHNKVSYSVAELMSELNNDGISSWVESKQVTQKVSRLIGTWQKSECIENKIVHHTWTVELVCESGRVDQIKGVHELPQILNRPFSGLLSTRSEDIRISQLQHQVTNSLAGCKPNQAVITCVSISTLENPKLRLKGCSSAAQAMDVARVYGKRLGLDPGEIEGPTTDGAYLVSLNGRLVYEAEFRKLRDSDPRFGREREFYLTDSIAGKRDFSRDVQVIVLESK